MSETELVFLSEMDRLELDATVTRVSEEQDRWSIVLDRTVFYPQGGGQPYDTGMISSESARLEVTEVRWEEGLVVHLGSLSGKLNEGDGVRLRVDRDRRMLNTRIHSAGHVVDMAIDRLGLGWIPGKGYHFPQGPYVEYSGDLAGDREEILARIESEAGTILRENPPTTVRFIELEDLSRYCRFVPELLPRGKVRVVSYGAFGVACGGTHVSRLGEIGSLAIRKIKARGGTIRVSYSVTQ